MVVAPNSSRGSSGSTSNVPVGGILGDNGEKEQLISSTGGPDHVAVSIEIDSRNVTRMAVAPSHQGVGGARVSGIQINSIVVRAHCKSLMVGTVDKLLNPFFGNLRFD